MVKKRETEASVKGRWGRGLGTLGVPGVEREINQERVGQARGEQDRIEPGEQRKSLVRLWCDLQHSKCDSKFQLSCPSGEGRAG